MNNQIVNERELERALKKPFAFEEIEWRIGSSFERNGEVKALALPYVTSRAIMDRLDEVFGFTGWSDEYKPWGNNAQLCAITVTVGDKTITKVDGAESSDIESVKGGLSNALKRTAVKFGIGRYLYSFDPVWVRCEVKGKSKFIAKDEFDTTLATFYKRQLTKIYGLEVANKNSTANVQHNQVRETNVNYNSSNVNYNNYNQNQSMNNANKNNNANSNRDAFDNSSNNNKAKTTDVNKAQNNVFNDNKSNNSTQNVPSALLTFIESRISAKGKNVKSILDYYNVSSLESLSMEQANDLVAKLG